MNCYCVQRLLEEEEEAKAELLHMQRMYAEEEKAIEEKEKKALKARAEAEAGVFEDGKSAPLIPPIVDASAARHRVVVLRVFCANCCAPVAACCILNYCTGMMDAGEKIIKLSKKEEQARLDAKRNKQGVRTAKTGSRRRKFDPELAEERKRETKAQQKKNVDNSKEA